MHLKAQVITIQGHLNELWVVNIDFGDVNIGVDFLELREGNVMAAAQRSPGSKRPLVKVFDRHACWRPCLLCFSRRSICHAHGDASAFRTRRHAVRVRTEARGRVLRHSSREATEWQTAEGQSRIGC